jgi:AcrR family transcriptional regulator
VSIVTATTTRDRILDALQDILIDEGHSGVTLEAVARAASVSKGGLLYHFPSKAALITGLIERLSVLAEAEFREAVESGEGVVRVFLRTSLPRSVEERELYWSVIAALRSKEDMPEEAAELVRHLFTRWGELLHEELTDPVLAEIILRAGDGLYMAAIAGLPQPDPQLTQDVFDRLVEAADRVRRPR